MSRRNHKERAQPLHRAKLGNLEKHKDYVHRARDYKSKQDRIRKLREIAAFRNKDEFYWGMIKGKTKGGVAIGDRGNEALSTDVVKLLKTQDMGYVRVQIAKDEKAISKIRAELEVTAPSSSSSDEWTAASELAEVEKLAKMGIVLNPRQSKKGKGKGKAPAEGHVVFAEDRSEFEQYGESSTEEVEGETEEAVDLGWEDPQPSKKRRSKAPAPEVVEIDEEAAAAASREHRLDLLSSLSAHLNRLKLLRQAESKLETTKGMMGKGAAQKVREQGYAEDESQPEDRNGERKKWQGKVWKWKTERRR
ncbi:U3 small nucleolar RNA-associated protein 11 [Cryptococcus wingfieldii CBS 7118]|uniref:U3 small nucleolar RNA-associated protein 11 n=1 Tax=Cryptococcus wingfieldii CBS 7118 TaxID=1295528 RepID=A0A1E3K011_9TREE|nr:U3 small nucleolar RNA-associated protein 11 [Cryptococcus wingfieldii CBS 7118]ODO06396.1 U3 small nucleolar RNA-associated protein 11 [Cryptococcus wingfieldii CBS 7118]